jgi:hypothetical protein
MALIDPTWPVLWTWSNGPRILCGPSCQGNARADAQSKLLSDGATFFEKILQEDYRDRLPAFKRAFGSRLTTQVGSKQVDWGLSILSLSDPG